MPRKGTHAESTRLDPDRIVSAALKVADRDGLSAMTLRKVGAELGADPTAVYRHFTSKDHLVAAMADRLFTGDVVERDLPTHWRPRLEVLLRAGRNIYRQHSALVQVLAGQPEDSPALVRVNETLVGCLADAGLSGEDVGLFHQLLVSLVMGAGTHDAGWNATGRDEREAMRRSYSALDPHVFPVCSAFAPYLFPSGDESFDLALGILLDAVESRGRSARTRGSGPRRAPSRKPGQPTTGGRATTTRRTTK